MGPPLPQFEVVTIARSPSFIPGHPSLRAQSLRPSATADGEGFDFYVEFRAARIGIYGHSYVAHGRLSGNGMPATIKYADVHPEGGFMSMVLGHFVPIAASTEPVEETLRREVISAYRRLLNPVEYELLTAAIAETRARCRTWNVFAYNCNDFCADVARAIGLRTPRTIMRPYRFIPALHRLNAPARSAADRAVPSGVPQSVSLETLARPHVAASR